MRYYLQLIIIVFLGINSISILQLSNDLSEIQSTFASLKNFPASTVNKNTESPSHEFSISNVQILDIKERLEATAFNNNHEHLITIINTPIKTSSDGCNNKEIITPSQNAPADKITSF